MIDHGDDNDAWLFPAASTRSHALPTNPNFVMVSPSRPGEVLSPHPLSPRRLLPASPIHSGLVPRAPRETPLCSTSYAACIFGACATTVQQIDRFVYS